MTDLTETESAPAPVVKPAEISDIVAAFELGLRDMRAAPLYSLAFGLFYAAGGILILLLATSLHQIWWSFPLAAGFALIGPFAAVGLYEVSRRRERGEPLNWHAVLTCIYAQGGREIGWMCLVSVFAFIIWMYQIRLLYALSFGIIPMAAQDTFHLLFRSEAGLLFLSIGTVIGAILSLVVFSLTVISFPILLDRDIDFVTAMITSVKAVIASPKVMIAWGWITAIVLLLSILPYFIGLIVTLPVLGHTTWHLYRRIVV